MASSISFTASAYALAETAPPLIFSLTISIERARSGYCSPNRANSEDNASVLSSVSLVPLVSLLIASSAAFAPMSICSISSAGSSFSWASSAASSTFINSVGILSRSVTRVSNEMPNESEIAFKVSNLSEPMRF